MKKPITSLSNETLYKIIQRCANLPEVRQEVLRNHDDNQWWPKSVRDWRVRLLVAGWSTRISYSMIRTYQSVVSRVKEMQYEEVCLLPENELLDILRPLGLSQTRIEYFRSVEQFIREKNFKEEDLIAKSNDALIFDFAKNVRGSGYKVAQCAILYAKGYHCGIFPVDSGMKDMLGPCLGIRLPSGPAAHEVMRKQLEQMLNSDAEQYQKLALESGYETLSFPEQSAPIWWAHLVLIYFKRLHCNHHKPIQCPLHSESDFEKYIGSMCDRLNPCAGGVKHIIFEGIDGTGKSTLAKELELNGYEIIHSPYNSEFTNIAEHYRVMIENLSKPTILDRSFISEMVYGSVLRGTSRITEDSFLQLLKLLSRKNFYIVYLYEDLDVIKRRLQQTSGEHSRVLSSLLELHTKYEQYIEKVKKYVPVIKISSSTMTKGQKVADFIADHISI